MIDRHLFHLIDNRKEEHHILQSKLIQRNNILSTKITTDHCKLIASTKSDLAHVTSSVARRDALTAPSGKFDDDRLTGHHFLAHFAQRPGRDGVERRTRPAFDTLIEQNPRSAS